MVNLYIFNESNRATEYGIGTYIRELTTALRNSDINVCIINLKQDITRIKTENIEGIEYWSFPAPIVSLWVTSSAKQNELYYRNIVFLLRLYIADKKNLIFHLNYYRCGKLAEDLKQTFDCRIVTVTHFFEWGSMVYDNLKRLRFILKEKCPAGTDASLIQSVQEEKAFFSQADRIVCVSKYMQKIIKQDYGIKTHKIVFIPNGLADSTIASCDRQALRQKWNIPDQEKIILFAGCMDEMKGTGYLIKAFREVLQVYSQCRLVIAGGGAFETYTKETREICTKVTYTGFLDRTQLYEWYRLSDIGATPSLFESFGYVAVEMMMHELPVVATATSGLNEVVDESCGYKIPLMETADSIDIDTTLLSDKMLYLLQHPNEARQMGRNGRARYLKKYASEVFRRNMIELYKDVSK